MRNISEEKILLYREFLLKIWRKLENRNYNEIDCYVRTTNEYYQILPIRKKCDQALYDDAIDLIEWINTHNNGVLPDNLQQLFNEFLLERL